MVIGDVGSAAKFEYKGSGSGDGLRVKFEVTSPASGPNVAKIESSDDRAEVGVQFNENDAPLRGTSTPVLKNIALIVRLPRAS